MDDLTDAKRAMVLMSNCMQLFAQVSWRQP